MSNEHNKAHAVPQGEPVAQVSDLFPSIRTKLCEMGFEPGSPLYTEPPQEPVTLTDDEMWSLWNSQGIDEMNQSEAIAFARVVIAALREKEGK